MNHQVVVNALLGGALIGLAASIMLLWNGRIAGVSGIAKGLIPLRKGDQAWRIAFLGGLVAGGALCWLAWPGAFQITTGRPLWAVAIAGLLVGFGSTLANGCTSGHGVCGVSRLSPRSMVATVVFMVAGFLTVFLYDAVRG